VGWFWFLGTLVPVIGLVQVGGQSMADRYTYLPLIGLFIMLCWSVPARALERRNTKAITGVAAVAALAACVTLSRIQVGYWKDSETLFRHALGVTRDNWLAHNNLGAALSQMGRIQEAITHYQQALRINPDFAEAHYDLGAALGLTGRMPDAIAQYEQAVRINPDFAEAHNNLGNALLRQGKVPEAIAHFEQALRIDPDFPKAQYDLGVALGLAGRMPEAIAHYEQASRMAPDDATVHSELGAALIIVGKPREALAHLEQALRIQPDLAEAQNNLAWVLATLPPTEGGNPVRAVSLAQRACELSGNRAPGDLDTLAVAYAAAGRFDAAVTTARRAIDLARSTGQTESAKEIEARLELYRSGRAYHPSMAMTSPSKALMQAR
jgi:tetratricopeptide (TPR) repeat protein